MAQKLLLGLLGANLGLTSTYGPSHPSKYQTKNKLTVIDIVYLLYDNRQKHAFTYEEMEARMDEVEGTLRGHIGLIEDSLQRIEERQQGGKVEGGWGQGMSEKAQAEYERRGKDERGKG